MNNYDKADANITAKKSSKRRQSIAVIPNSHPPPPSNNAIHNMNASVLDPAAPPRHSNTVMDDPRPITDKSFMKKNINALYKYLMNVGYEYPITVKSLHLPSAKDFQQIVTYLIRRFDPTFATSSMNMKFEDEVCMAFKALGYPFPISKTGLVAAGSPHTWPALLAALSWLVELLQYDEIRQRSEADDNHGDNNDDRNDDDTNNMIDMKEMIAKSEKDFFKYLLEAYEMFLCGDDERHDELEEGLIEMFEIDNAKLEQEKNRIMDSTVTMLEMVENLRSQGDVYVYSVYISIH